MEPANPSKPPAEPALRELPQLSLRIAPLREPVSSRTLSVPSPLEPNASGARDSNNISKAKNNVPAANAQAGLPTVTEFLNAARTKTTDPTDSPSSVERPPRPILPAFVNLRALEKFPFSTSFDDSTPQGTRKRRRLDHQADSFSEHLQLPIPQAQKEQRPPPFGPFAILNGLNEPPPNAAFLPPIEVGSNISQLLTKPSGGDADLDAGASASGQGTTADGQPAERRGARIEEILRTSLSVDEDDTRNDNYENIQSTNTAEPDKTTLSAREADPSQGSNSLSTAPKEDAPMSPKSRGRSRKNLRRWTDEETTNLLRGVVKCGIGNWTAILAQPELEFNQRTASNLKDRFRVLCPWAYRASDPNEAARQLHETLTNALLKAKAGGSDNIPAQMQIPKLMRTESGGSDSTSGSGSPAVLSRHSSTPSTLASTPDTEVGNVMSPSPGQSTLALSNQSRSTLESLGIPQPHVAQIKRRSRRPFTPTEDEALLKGYAVHGFQWTLIQQDSRLNLSHRKATDLRDRFRTKFPHAYRDGGSVSGKAMTSQSPSQSDSAGASTPRPTVSNIGEHSPSKGRATPTLADPRLSRESHPTTSSHSNSTHIDPALLPPPPQGFLDNPMPLPAAGGLSFSLDEGSGPAPSVEAPWEDNTLAPMIWDELA
ncbi:unnamed protein product [Penicillium salamii]|uniref:Uncharacterized protein n=1 Tax=Penicillium salamii TaxID=1612424 RepID=A0A9W4N5N8_9EURO|nr:unnamed protein product [Penicillium salamii]CAG8234586.1 unnamed protein product [Penicillium salamii]CAG8253449.1 unnamed protein product [Penicillium salamii]CAG8263065.1 unnamed protein product [Penicillium salamii]CAG8349933.1 unnamed protein product [Penicillium salamii]